jgi:hypothetical protein
MPIKKYAHAQIQDVVTMQAWNQIAHPGAKVASAAKLAADNSKYLLSHCTIMASVMTEAAPYDYLIKPETSIFVNNNQDAWSNGVLKQSFRSFVGAFNFLEHYQNSKASKGHILDAVLRKVYITPDTWVYYCDILVATDLAHTDLVADIMSDRVKYMSMGCLTDLVICSYCGAHCTEPSTYCNHLMYQKGTFIADEGGVPRRVAELCGHESLPNGGVKFVEASWVNVPAFPGDAKRNIIQEEWVGPKSPYSHKAASHQNMRFSKAASAPAPVETTSTDAKVSAYIKKLAR